MKLIIETGENNEIQRKKAQPIVTLTKKILKLVKNMEETMFSADGVGLAAPQIGVSLKITVVSLDGKKAIPFLNPVITAHSDEMIVEQEGCLSLPERWEDVARYKEITLRFMNIKGDAVALKLEGFAARVLQHEIDHLNGILFIDRVDLK